MLDDDLKTRSPTTYDPLPDAGEGGSDHDTLELEELGVVHPRWASSTTGDASRSARCRIVERLVLAFLTLLVLVLTCAPSLPSAAADGVKTLLGATAPPAAECDPYDLPGVLRFNYENRTANFWEPALSQCRARDYMTAVGSRADAVPELDFLRGRTVMFFGDSVDRFALKHFCELTGGEVETI